MHSTIVPETIESRIHQVYESFAADLIKGEIHSVGAVLSANFFAITSDGVEKTRAEWLESLASEASLANYESVETEISSVEQVGGRAHVTASTSMIGTLRSGQRFDVIVESTDVFTMAGDKPELTSRRIDARRVHRKEGRFAITAIRRHQAMPMLQGCGDFD